MRKSFFIINPAAGRHQGLKLVETIEANWKNAGIDHQIYVTCNHEDIAVGVENAWRLGATEIIIVGGDGTILAAVNALKGRRMPLGFIPCGSGNDFVRSNGLSLNVERAIQQLLHKPQFKEIDVGTCNGTHFLNVASVGIDAAIVQRTLKIKRWIKGPLVYLIASIAEIFTFSPMTVQITIDGRAYHRTIELAAIANGRYYGGGMKIAPLADASDGLYDVVLISEMKRSRLLRLLPTLYSGDHLREPEVEVLTGQTITIQAAHEMTINLDGELITDKMMVIEKPDHRIVIIGI